MTSVVGGEGIGLESYLPVSVLSNHDTDKLRLTAQQQVLSVAMEKTTCDVTDFTLADIWAKITSIKYKNHLPFGLIF